ncbi:S8 family peptidase [Kineosporia sp. A_224]|uniref:S8 family peptidase n=1 Tax=Kineosporia sp. A_224 TaxID=1962180 RepID=UPI000B4BAB0C|nr:S8 family peptidase [Kineosporia sp. A_224]
MSTHEAAASPRRTHRPFSTALSGTTARPARRLGAVLLATALATLTVAPAASAATTPTPAPLLKSAGRAVPGQYIVVLKSGTGRSHGGRVVHSYGTALKGFAARLTAAQLKAVRGDANVAYVAPDAVVTASVTQTGATWGLDRIDQRARPLNGTYTYNTTASNVTAYVIDTGIRTTHNQFGGRATGGFTAVNDGRGTNDCNGHGTHVAGTIGGSTYGVAKGVRLVAVRVLDCAGSGTLSGVIAGIDWVTRNHVTPSVANMSLGGGASSALDTAVANSIASGVTYGVAAGNENQNACNTSPARVGTAITVGSTTSTDARSSFSNFGSCLDVFAPGSSITSAWNTSNTATNTISGTSMATPHVVGVAALYLANNPSASPATVRNAIVNGATTGVVTSPGTNSPNRLLFSLI